jgi:hypothetical protein
MKGLINVRRFIWKGKIVRGSELKRAKRIEGSDTPLVKTSRKNRDRQGGGNDDTYDSKKKKAKSIKRKREKEDSKVVNSFIFFYS